MTQIPAQEEVGPKKRPKGIQPLNNEATVSKAILSPPPLSTQPGSAAAQQKRDHIQAPLGAHAKVDARSHNAPFPFRMLLFAQRACVFFVRPPYVESCVPNHGIRPFGQLRTAKARTP